jgi:long-chain-fatty-acyl-CoA reductase
VLHYLVGNLPLASMASLLRGILTRNRNLAKLPVRDPVSPIAFIEAMQRLDPSHPITRSMSAAYWPHDDAIEEPCLDMIDAACIWGGADAVTAIKRKIPAGVPIAEYGPRWSASVIDLDRVDPFEAACRLVSDAAYYDQETCLSAQRAFVVGYTPAFRDELSKALELFARRYPMQSANRDALALRSATLLEAVCVGLEVHTTDDSAIVVTDDPAAAPPHPLARTLYVHPVTDAEGITRHFDRRVQTLGVFPWELSLEHRDAWVGAGADRIVELGMARHPRPGFTHDGTRALQPLVRVACVERPTSHMGKYALPSLEYEDFLQWLFVMK